MANLAIIDTGYLNINDTGGQAPDIVNSGNAITLKAVDLTVERAANVDTTEIINSNNSPVAGFGTVGAAKITINGVLDRKTSGDMDKLDQLNDLLATYGVKLLYYDDTTDGYRDITDSIDKIGEIGTSNANDVHKTNNFSGTATPHLHVRFTQFRIRQTPSSHLRFTLEGVTTN